MSQSRCARGQGQKSYHFYPAGPSAFSMSQPNSHACLDSPAERHLPQPPPGRGGGGLEEAWPDSHFLVANPFVHL